MPNLRDIKSRIKSIQNTQKITKAMKMVAGAKVRRVEGLVRASRPFTSSIVKLFKRIVTQAPFAESTGGKITSAIENYPALLKVRPVKSFGLLVITSDKGLAGAYNANVVRKAQAIIKENSANGVSTKLFVIGNKGINALKMFLSKENYNAEIVHQYAKLPAIPTVGGANIITEDIAEYFVDEKIDQFNIVSTKFISMLSFQVQNSQILPAVLDSSADEESLAASETLFEPDVESLLQMVVPMYLSNTVYQMMTESAASELAARMAAMSAATNNANEMTRKLTILYNKARQANITQELLEVVSGADALKG